MCAERIHRFLMAIVLTAVMVIFALSETGLGVALMSIIIFFMVVWALTDWCPSLWVFKKIFGSCYDK